MSYVEDTRIKDGHYAPGTILDDGKWRVEFDSMGQVKVPGGSTLGSADATFARSLRKWKMKGVSGQ